MARKLLQEKFDVREEGCIRPGRRMPRISCPWIAFPVKTIFVLSCGLRTNICRKHILYHISRSFCIAVLADHNRLVLCSWMDFFVIETYALYKYRNYHFMMMEDENSEEVVYIVRVVERVNR